MQACPYRKKPVRATWAVLLTLAGTACSTMPRDFETPKFGITDIAPKNVTIFDMMQRTR